MLKTDEILEYMESGFHVADAVRMAAPAVPLAWFDRLSGIWRCATCDKPGACRCGGAR